MVGGGPDGGQKPDTLKRRLPGIGDPLLAQSGKPSKWLWLTGIARICVLMVVVSGAQMMVRQRIPWSVLTGVYIAALVCSSLYLITVRKSSRIPPVLVWTQIFLDFGAVALTISFTGGPDSLFTFLMVMVILEAGVLLGIVQGLYFAAMACVFMFTMFFNTPGMRAPHGLLPWYQFLVQCMAFFFTALVSGYWNQRLSRMNYFQREILNNLSSGFLMADAHGRIFGANNSARRILGVEGMEIAGMHAEAVLVPESGAECPIVTAIREGRDFSSYEFPARTRSGGVKLLGLTTNRLHDRHGRLETVFAVFADLTEIARMRQELQRQDRMAAIGELAAELAHEIRNPVTSIRGAVEEIGRMDNPRELNERLAGIALRESDHLNNIVIGFLDFARAPDLNRAGVNLAELAAEIKATYEGRHGELSVTLDLPPEGDVEVVGDRTKLRQLFTNLAQNAVEAMNGRGALAVSIRRVAGTMEIRFDDNGPGIPPDKVARIFEPFYTEKERGVGMGLPTCLRIVTAHDGTLQAAARPGGGASLIVRLPAVRHENA